MSHFNLIAVEFRAIFTLFDVQLHQYQNIKSILKKSIIKPGFYYYSVHTNSQY